MAKSETILGIDVSGYQDPERVNYAELKAQGFSFAVVKIGQYLTEEHVTRARSAGLEVGGYWWNDPLDAPGYQARMILAEVQRLGLRFAALDLEQFWRDWGAYWLWLAKKIPLSQVPKFTPAEISANAQQVMTLVKAAIAVPWIVYTADWFLESYAAPVRYWISEYDSWVAQYIDRRDVDHHKSWTQLRALTRGEIEEGARRAPLPAVAPLVESRVRIWQVSGSFIYPGRSYDAYDTDLFMGSQADLSAWLKGAGPAPLPAFIPYLVKSTATAGLRVRSEPSTATGAILRKFWPDSPPVLILEERNGWGRFCSGWISLEWVKKV